jgi:hypothetical protein
VGARRIRIYVGAGALLALAALVLLRCLAPRQARTGAPVPPRVDATYAEKIQPIIDRRCVVCHACFDAPCQLNLQSFAGLDRGANDVRVYEPSRLERIPPTRMFQDAQTTSEWQAKFGFFPVVARDSPTSAPPEGSLLWRLVEQRRRTPVRIAVSIDAPWVCPARVAALDDELRSHPEKGMPYGFPPLGDDEAGAFEAWLRGGAGGPAAVEESERCRGAIARWEDFFNAQDAKSRLVARYLYEHLYVAHLAIEGAPGEWFRLVRSRTQAPAAIDEIVTTRPYDDPGSREMYYRLRRIKETIVEKTHVPYVLGDEKLERLRHIFFSDAEWTDPSPAFPSYDPAVAANPFIAFGAIPARSRYQFLLDDAYYHVRAFIHGPVCKGQVALNVIDEHFLIFFLAPGADPSIAHPDYLRRAAADLAVPAEGGDGVEAVYARFKILELSYLRSRASFLRTVGAPGRTMADIWNGDGTNRGAVLTVYRHFDSAFVAQGAVGGLPKTAWVLDYPIFERMYYDLVAGFDVFGNLVHQVSTRRYMNLLRIEAESSFLSFLPESRRGAVRDTWYRPHGVSKVVDVLDPSFAEPETRVTYSNPANAKDELITRLVSEVLPRAVVGERDPVQWPDVVISGEDAASRFERAVRRMTRREGAFVGAFPDATLVRLRTGERDDAIYTIVRNKAHLNIDFMFLEDEERVPAEDTLHVVRGVVVSRPNLFLDVGTDAIDRFVADVMALDSSAPAWVNFLGRYGVRRSDPAFWAASDFFNERFSQMDPLASGILDLSRYIND